MVALGNVQSGFDVETLLGEEFIRYLLFNSVDTGDLATQYTFAFALSPTLTLTVNLTLKLPQDIRRHYEVNPDTPAPPTTPLDSFTVELLEDNDDGTDINLGFIADVVVTGGLPLNVTDTQLTLGARFDLVERRNQTTNALQSIDLDFSILTMESDNPALQALIDANTAVILSQINASLAGGFSGQLFSSDGVQNVSTRKFTGNSSRRALGVYLNLALNDGPEEEDIRPERGTVDNALNLLEPGQHLAFAMNPELFDFLETHLEESFAAEASSGEFYYPIEAGGEELGFLKGVTVKVVNSKYTLPDGTKSENMAAIRLLIRANSKYANSDFKLTYDLFPVVEDGLLRWETDYDVDVDILFEFIPFWAFYGLTLMFGLPGLIASGVLATVMLGVQEGVIEPYIKNEYGDDISEQSSTALAFFDLIPHRLTLAQHRWDPLYTTLHQVLTVLDFFELSKDGFALSGQVCLAQQTVPVSNAVLRDIQRNEAGVIDTYQYRVPDFARHRRQFTNQQLGSNRQPYVQDETEPELFHLTFNQLTARLLDGQLVRSIPYEAQTVDIEDNQVYRMLCLSESEIAAGEEPRLEMAPDEFGRLQAIRALGIKHYDLIYRLGVPYYRDRADRRIDNNLMEQPQYETAEV